MWCVLCLEYLGSPCALGFNSGKVQHGKELFLPTSLTFAAMQLDQACSPLFHCVTCTSYIILTAYLLANKLCACLCTKSQKCWACNFFYLNDITPDAPYGCLLFTIQVSGQLLLLFAIFQSLSCVRLFVTPWTAAHQASLSFTISQSLLKLMPIESVMPSNHLILYCSLLLLPSIFPSITDFSNESALYIRWSASVLPMNIQGWFPLGLTFIERSFII